MIKLYLKNDKKILEEEKEKPMTNSRIHIDLREIKDPCSRGNYSTGKCKLCISDPIKYSGFYKIPLQMVALEGIYGDFIFDFNIYIHENYPFKQPRVYCENKIWHPNINYKTGEVHLIMLKETEWIPVLNLNCLVFALELIILEPNLNCVPLACPENYECANLYQSNPIEFERIVSVFKNENQKIFTNGEIVFSRLEKDLKKVRLRDNDMELEGEESNTDDEIKFERMNMDTTIRIELSENDKLTPRLYTIPDTLHPKHMANMDPSSLNFTLNPSYKRPREEDCVVNPALKKIKI